MITRFDREGKQRVPVCFGSDSSSGSSTGSSGCVHPRSGPYRQFGDDVAGDLRQLWRRLIFSLLASNYDDHVRNHGFLMQAVGRWSLSPAYDINPVPEIDRARVNKMRISEQREELGVAGALSVAPRFGLRARDAKEILREVLATVSVWKKNGRRRLRLKKTALDTYTSAFENELTEEAQRSVSKG